VTCLPANLRRQAFTMQAGDEDHAIGHGIHFLVTGIKLLR
jgi:hypothetical protein